MVRCRCCCREIGTASADGARRNYARQAGQSVRINISRHRRGALQRFRASLADPRLKTAAVGGVVAMAMMVVVVVAATFEAASVVMAATSSDGSCAVFYYFEFTVSAGPAYRVSAAGVIGGRVLIETPRLSIVSLVSDNAAIVIICSRAEIHRPNKPMKLHQ